MNAMESLQRALHGWLRWSERYTKTDMVYLTTGGFWLAVGQGAQMVLGFASAVVFANYLPPELYGNFRYILSVTAIIAAFSLSGISTAISGAVSRGNDGLFPEGFRAILAWSWVMVLVGAVGGVYYLLQGNTLLGVAMFMAGAANPLIVASSVYDSFFEGRKIFRERILYSIVRNAVPMIAVMVAVLSTDNLIIILAVYFLFNAVVAYGMYWRTLKQYARNSLSEPGALRYGIHISAINFIGTIAQNIDRVLLFQMLGGTPLAVFSFAQSPLTYMQTGFQMLKALMFPKFANQKVSEIHSSAGRKVVQLAAASVSLTVLYIVIAPFFFKTFFPLYVSAIPYSRVLALITLSSPTIVFAQTLLAHKRQNELYSIRVVTLTTKIGLLFLLIPLFALWGAVAAALASKAIESMTLTYYFWKLRDHPLS